MRGRVLCVYNDAITEETFKQKNSLLIEEARKNNVFLDYKSSADVYTFIDNNKIKSHNNFDNFNYTLFFDKDFHLAKSLEMMGVKVVNSARSIETCENKASMYQCLASSNINIPKSVIFPNMDKYNKTLTEKFLSEAITDLGLPLVVKNWFGASGKNVFLAKNKNQLFEIVESMQGKEILLQEYILESAGTDIRIFVCKNKIFSAIRRQGVTGDFRSNVSLGGVISRYVPTIMDEQLAIAATKAVGCDFAIVDILKSINGPVVCEVNTTANVNYFYDACDVNIPQILFKNIK